MKDIGLVLLLTLLGPLFVVQGARSLRSRAWHDGVPALELVIDRALGEEPPPRTAWDRRFALFQSWMAIILGSFFSLCLLAVVVSLVSE